mmetsp:Transcript_2431/g.6395  ORF Transcript_2431/g.6395 Transcript_2431/m.6395 type:complete len:89 (+) Transcript_2431:75-341(+)
MSFLCITIFFWRCRNVTAQQETIGLQSLLQQHVESNHLAPIPTALFVICLASQLTALQTQRASQADEPSVIHSKSNQSVKGTSREAGI